MRSTERRNPVAIIPLASETIFYRKMKNEIKAKNKLTKSKAQNKFRKSKSKNKAKCKNPVQHFFKI